MGSSRMPEDRHAYRFIPGAVTAAPGDLPLTTTSVVSRVACADTPPTVLRSGQTHYFGPRIAA